MESVVARGVVTELGDLKMRLRKVPTDEVETGGGGVENAARGEFSGGLRSDFGGGVFLVLGKFRALTPPGRERCR